MEDVLKEGDKITVKLIEVDARTGKLRLSRRVLEPKPEGYVEPRREPREPRGERRGGYDRHDRPERPRPENRLSAPKLRNSNEGFNPSDDMM